MPIDMRGLYRYQAVLSGHYPFVREQPALDPLESEEQRTSSRYTPYTVASPADFSLRQFATPERLQAVFRILAAEGGDGPGTDGFRYSDLSRGEVYSSLRCVSPALRERRYRPYATRLVRIPKGDGRYRELQLQCIIDRVIAKALQICLDGYWRTQLPGLGRDVWHIYADIQRTMRERNAYYLATDDIRDCFPSAPIAHAIACHRQHISQSDLLWLVETIIRGQEGLENTTGLSQGSPYSPVAMELLLRNRLDAEYDARRQGNPPLLRYVDNLTIACISEREGNQALEEIDGILQRTGLTLKHDEGDPTDLRQTKRKVLGLRLGWLNEQLTFEVPEETFQNLEEKLTEALASQKPVETAKLIVNGMINSIGPALTRRVANTTIDGIHRTARNCGFVELSLEHLRETAHDARQRWLRTSETQERVVT